MPNYQTYDFDQTSWGGGMGMFPAYQYLGGHGAQQAAALAGMAAHNLRAKIAAQKRAEEAAAKKAAEAAAAKAAAEKAAAEAAEAERIRLEIEAEMARRAEVSARLAGAEMALTGQAQEIAANAGQAKALAQGAAQQAKNLADMAQAQKEAGASQSVVNATIQAAQEKQGEAISANQAANQLQAAAQQKANEVAQVHAQGIQANKAQGALQAQEIAATANVANAAILLQDKVVVLQQKQAELGEAIHTVEITTAAVQEEIQHLKQVADSTVTAAIDEGTPHALAAIIENGGIDGGYAPSAGSGAIPINIPSGPLAPVAPLPALLPSIVQNSPGMLQDVIASIQAGSGDAGDLAAQLGLPDATQIQGQVASPFRPHRRQMPFML